MIRQWQEIFYAGNYHSAHLLGPDFAKLADAFGIPAFRARTPDEVDPAIEAAQAVDGPALIWFEIAETQNVFPMMPAGKGLSDLIEKWDGPDGGRGSGPGQRRDPRSGPFGASDPGPARVRRGPSPHPRGDRAQPAGRAQ